jgi:tetratricopeptide (TPR) repeat protein
MRPWAIRVSPMRWLTALCAWIFLVLPGAAAGVAAGAAVVTVVGLDAQGHPGPQGLGVVVSKDGQVLTSAALFAASRRGVVKTPAGPIHLIRNFIHVDALQDLALVRVEANDLPMALLAPPGKLQSGEQILLPVKKGEALVLQEAQLTGVLPISPRLTMLKLSIDQREKAPGTPVFNHRGELAGMLHSFAGAPGSAAFHCYLALGQIPRPAKEAAKGQEEEAEPTATTPEGLEQLSFWQGVMASNRQAWREAQEKFTAALGRAQNLPEAFYGRGVARCQQGDLEGAEKDLEEACRRLPGYALAYLWLGKIRAKRGQVEAARGAFEQAAALAPDLSEAWFFKGELAYREGRLTEARESLEKARDDFPQAAERWWYLGNIGRTEGRREEALAAFQQAIKLDPKFASAYLEGGRVLLDLGRSREAARLLAEAVKLEPGQGRPRFYLGLAYLLSWNPGGAWEQYFALKKISPDLAANLEQLLEQYK